MGLSWLHIILKLAREKFTDFAKRMMDDLGEGIKPYLKSIYESARRMPGMEDVAKDMDSTQDVDAFNFDSPQARTKTCLLLCVKLLIWMPVGR